MKRKHGPLSVHRERTDMPPGRKVIRKTIIILAALIFSACSYPGATKPTDPPGWRLSVEPLRTIGPEATQGLNRSVTFHVTGDKIAINSEIWLTRRTLLTPHQIDTSSVNFSSKIINPVWRVPFSWTYEFRSFEEGSLKLTFNVWTNRGSQQGITFVYEGGQ